MSGKTGKIVVAAVLALGATISAASANCEGSKTTGTLLGAGTGGVVGDVITHGSAVGLIGGVVVGGLAGHSIAASDCHRDYHHYRHGYYDRYHYWHYYS